MRKFNIERHYGSYLITGRSYGPEGILVQSDWDFPSVARDLGWNMRRVQPSITAINRGIVGVRPARILKRAPNDGQGCGHSATDGTIDCENCGLTAAQFIGAARDYLDSLC